MCVIFGVFISNLFFKHVLSRHTDMVDDLETIKKKLVNKNKTEKVRRCRCLGDTRRRGEML